MSKVCTVFLAAAFVIAVSTNIASGGTLLTVPRSSVIVKGDGVELNCSINGSETLIWIFTSRITSNETKIYLGRGILDSVRSRYSIDNSTRGQRNLIINSADMAHAGRYLCRSPTVTGAEAAAQLTVIGTFPECSTNKSTADKGIKEHGYLWAWCRVIYTGNMIPIFAWTKSNIKNPIAANTTTSDKRTLSLTTTSSVIAQLSSDDNGAIFKCKITFQLPNNTKGNAPDYEYTWNYTANVLCQPLFKDSSKASWKEFLIISAAIGGAVLFFLIIFIIICCVVRRKRLKGNTSARPDVALETDINSYDDIALSSGRSPNGVRDGNSSRGRTREEKRAMNDQPSAIYADVKRKVNVNGSSTGRNGANLGENPQPSQTPNPGNKNCIGDDGTVYAELGEMKQQPTNKVQSAKPPVFSQVEIYASIDHRGIVPPPPPKL